MMNTETKPRYRVNSYKLYPHRYAQCHIETVVSNITDEIEAVRFVSYDTLVIEARQYHGTTYTGRNLYTLECTGTYSQTTRKQIGWFLNECFPGVKYCNVKPIAGTGKMLVVAPVPNVPFAEWRVSGRE